MTMRIAQISDLHFTHITWNPFRLFSKKAFRQSQLAFHTELHFCARAARSSSRPLSGNEGRFGALRRRFYDNRSSGGILPGIGVCQKALAGLDRDPGQSRSLHVQELAEQTFLPVFFK